jgi:hypothetical protein
MRRGSQRLSPLGTGLHHAPGPPAEGSVERTRPTNRQIRTTNRRRRKPSWPFIALLILLLGPSPASAQEFGQWTWEALLGLGGRSRDTLTDGQTGSRFDERNVGLSLGMNGFVLHPAVTRFRLGLDLQLTDTDTGQSLDTDRIGLHGNFELFPRSPYRGSLHFNRQLYDYAGAAADDPLTLLSVPDTHTTYGGRFRASQGFMAGSLLGFERSRVDFVGPATDEQVYDRQFYDWARLTEDFSHHVRLEHRFRNLGTVDVEYDELRFNLDESGHITPDWHWTLTGSAFRQDSENFGLGPQRIDDYQLRSRLVHDAREKDLLELSYEFGLTSADTRSSTESHGISATYKWRPNSMWHVGPIVSYAQISSDFEEIQAPRVGVIAGWDWSRLEWDAGFIARGNYGVIERDAAGMTQDESQAAGSLIGTLGHGTMEGLRKEFELEMDRNRLRVTQTGLIAPPGLGLPLPGLGTEDVLRARVTLGHQWDSQFLNAWGDWNRREAKELITNQDVVSETLTATLQYGARRFDLKANLAETDLEVASQNDQSIRTIGVAAIWRPSRYVTLRSSYRLDDRSIALAPDIDGTQFEAGVRWQVGLLYLDATFLESNQRLSGGPETTLRSLTWTVSRRFGGWLPIVSGPGRRGVIR